jgi:hypothetical protein
MPSSSPVTPIESLVQRLDLCSASAGAAEFSSVFRSGEEELSTPQRVQPCLVARFSDPCLKGLHLLLRQIVINW